MKNFFIRLKKIIRGNEGMAMTEILVAFVILIMCFAMLYTCMRLASSLILKSGEMDRNHAVYQKGIEEKLATDSYPTDGNGTITYSFNGGYTFTLSTATISATDAGGNSKDLPIFAVPKKSKKN